MKLNGILGSGKGKLGSSVFTTNAGNTIVRQHNPHVRNPKTERQINSRNRLAVASRLSREFSNLIAAGGLSEKYASKRNAFIQSVLRKDADIISLENEQLVVDYTKLQFSRSIMPPVPIKNSVITSNRTLFVLFFEHDYTPQDYGFQPEEDGQVGYVVALVADNEQDVIEFFVTREIHSYITKQMNPYANLNFTKGYIFAKWIPKSKNNILTTDTPWKFPSETSRTSYFDITYERGPIKIDDNDR